MLHLNVTNMTKYRLSVLYLCTPKIAYRHLFFAILHPLVSALISSVSSVFHSLTSAGVAGSFGRLPASEISARTPVHSALFPLSACLRPIGDAVMSRYQRTRRLALSRTDAVPRVIVL